VNDDWFVDNIYLGPSASFIALSEDSLSFDTTQLDSTSILDLEVYNLGFDTLSVTEIISTNEDFSANLGNLLVGGGLLQTLQVSFSPSQPGLRSGWLYLLSNDPVQDTMSVWLSGIGEGTSGLESRVLPRSYQLYQNYPNPFNPTTTINFELPQKTELQIVVYNLLGQHIRTLAESTFEAGRYRIEWDGKNEAGFRQASGIYIYRFESKSYVKTLKMILMK